jgi:hypothetical protein
MALSVEGNGKHSLPEVAEQVPELPNSCRHLCRTSAMMPVTTGADPEVPQRTS